MTDSTMFACTLHQAISIWPKSFDGIFFKISSGEWERILFSDVLNSIVLWDTGWVKKNRPNSLEIQVSPVFAAKVFSQMESTHKGYDCNLIKFYKKFLDRKGVVTCWNIPWNGLIFRLFSHKRNCIALFLEEKLSRFKTHEVLSLLRMKF